MAGLPCGGGTALRGGWRRAAAAGLLPQPALGIGRGVSWKPRAAASPRSAPRAAAGGRGGGGSARGRQGAGRPPRGGAEGQQQQQWRQGQPWQRPDGAAGHDSDGSWRERGRDQQGPAGGEDGAFLYPPRPSRASYVEALAGEALYGVAPILAALSAGSRTPHELLLQEGLSPQQRKDARALADIQRLAKAAGASVRHVSKHELNMLAGNRPHQGLVLDASPLQWRPLDVLAPPEELEQPDCTAPGAAAGAPSEQQQQQQQGQPVVRHPVWLALDEVVDPQNLGAMLRSAYCLGAAGVLGCSRNCAPLSPVVSKASAGAAELMPLYSCRSMPRTLADAAAKGWAVVGAAAEDGAVPVSAVKVDRPTVLVMGNEGYGLRATVKRCCTRLVQIEMAAAPAGQQQQQLVDSLNVSVATGILLHQLLTAAAAGAP